jgi:hypothetical protein
MTLLLRARVGRGSLELIGGRIHGEVCLAVTVNHPLDVQKGRVLVVDDEALIQSSQPMQCEHRAASTKGTTVDFRVLLVRTAFDRASRGICFRLGRANNGPPALKRLSQKGGDVAIPVYMEVSRPAFQFDEQRGRQAKHDMGHDYHS